ncbi:MAG: FtsX-like permease family protein [Pseudomonadota bacterium]
MLSPRWIKMVRDVGATPGRIALMVLAMAAGVCALATMLSSYTILAREVPRNYLATNPPSAMLRFDAITPELVARVRRFPGIREAQAGTTVGATLRTSAGQTMALTIFVVDDFRAMSINTVFPEAGARVPPDGALLLERDALKLIAASIGDSVSTRSADGSLHILSIAGTVHDPALPPATRGSTVYAYASPATVMQMGLNGKLRTLKVTVRERALDAQAVEATVARLATWLREQGTRAERISVPPPGEHPHARIMNSILLMLLAFSAIALLLSAVLGATVLGAMLAQQRRQIGVMKAIGASGAQLARLYLGLVAAIAIAATVLGMAGGIAAGRAFAAVVLMQILNFGMASDAISHLVYLALACAGILLPLALAAIPIRQATRATVQAAMGDFGSARQYYSASGRWLEALPFVSRSLLMALRNSLRRRARLALTLALLSLAGAMTISSLNVRKAAQQHLLEAALERHYDLETILAKPASPEQVAYILQALPAVARVEAWPRTLAAKARSDGLEIERVYPDGDHGTLGVLAVPPDTRMLALPLLEGRWLRSDETLAVVLNNTAALNFFPGAKVGADIDVSSHGHTARLRVVGIARQYMSPATLFVNDAALSALTGQSGQSSAYRIITRAHDAGALDAAAAAIETAMSSAGLPVRMTITETMMRKDVDGHFDLMIAALLFISGVMGVAGAFGLASAMGSSVAERSREFGIMRSIGASTGVVLRNVLSEGVFVGFLSLPLAIALTLPLSAAIGAFLGNLLFGLPFPFVLSQKAVLLWSILVLGGAMAASIYPAWRAARLSIHQTLSHL